MNDKALYQFENDGIHICPFRAEGGRERWVVEVLDCGEILKPLSMAFDSVEDARSYASALDRWLLRNLRSLQLSLQYCRDNLMAAGINGAVEKRIHEDLLKQKDARIQELEDRIREIYLEWKDSDARHED